MYVNAYSRLVPDVKRRIAVATGDSLLFEAPKASQHLGGERNLSSHGAIRGQSPREGIDKQAQRLFTTWTQNGGMHVGPKNLQQG